MACPVSRLVIHAHGETQRGLSLVARKGPGQRACIWPWAVSDHGDPVQLLLRPIANDGARDVRKPLATGSRDPSAPPGSREEQGGGPPDTPPAASISSAQLVRVAADLHRLQEQVSPSRGSAATRLSARGECVASPPLAVGAP